MRQPYSVKVDVVKACFLEEVGCSLTEKESTRDKAAGLFLP